MAKKTGKTSFEKAMQELEEIVLQLEEGQLDLEESMALYEKGMALSKECMQMLETAQERVRILVCGDEKVEELPFTVDEDLRNDFS